MNIFEKAKNDGAKIYLKTAGLNIGSGARDLKAFNNEITEQEKILCIITGKLVQISNDRSRGMRHQGQTGTDTKGVMVITDRQAVFLDKRLFGKQTIIIDGQDISAVNLAGGIISSKIQITTYGTNYDITDLKKDAANDALAALQSLKKNTKNTGGTTIHKEASAMEEVKKAKKLLDEGIISQEEFKKIKQKHII